MNNPIELNRCDIWKTVLFVSVALQGVPAAGAFMVAAASWLWIGDSVAAALFLLFAVLVGGVSVVCYRWVDRPYVNVLAVNSAAVAVGWLLASILCAIPMAVVCELASDPNATTEHLSQPINALYESTSSISSSGLTVAAKSSEIPSAVQLWRSINQWIGGVGLAVFALLILDSAEQGSSLYAAETRSWRPGETVRATVRRVLCVYLGLTLTCAGLFAIAGMNAWETVNHSLIIVSTGGLTVTDDSFGSYGMAIQVIATGFMLLGSVSFGAIYLASHGRLRQLGKQSDLRAMLVWAVSLLGIFLFQAWLQAGNDSRDSSFNVISAISTCGVSSGKVSEFSVTSIWILIIAMFIGGCGDSTAGGLKVNRALWMVKCLIVQLQISLSLVDSAKRPSWSGAEVERDDADQRTGRVLVMLFVFLVTLSIGFLALRLSYDNSITSDRVLFQSTSAIGAVGLSMDLSGPDRPTSAKLVEIVLMIAGRLEIIALLFVLPVVIGFVHRDANKSKP